MSRSFRGRESRRGKVGSGTQPHDAQHIVLNAISAMGELKRLGKPKPRSFGHHGNVRDHIANGTVNLQYWHALIDYRNGNRHLLHKPLTMQEAFRKNAFLRGSGKAWARFEPPKPA